MDISDLVQTSNGINIKTIEMHTSGEPTRIVYAGYPELTSTSLLGQRAQAKALYDFIRVALICEPRGHREMYGAILRTRTELVDNGEADMGVLFMTNDGYSTMCGHATLAVARLLVDCAGRTPSLGSMPLFPALRERLIRDLEKDHDTVSIRLHVPCGLVQVVVPIRIRSVEDKTWACDTTRPIQYISVPSFAAGIDVVIPIPPSLRWPELRGWKQVVVDIAYGGAFYIIATPHALGFTDGTLRQPDIAALSVATKRLKAAFNTSEHLREKYLHHPDSPDLQFLYATILVDKDLGIAVRGTISAETGICFFADQQIDRSPTGSGVQARVALAVARKERLIGESWTYHSLVTNAHNDDAAFVGVATKEVEIAGRSGVVVKVSGWARYTGSCTFVVEDADEIGKGFWFGESA